jgi:hypothetical protein
MDKFTDVTFVGGVFATLAIAGIILLQVIKELTTAISMRMKLEMNHYSN